MDDEQVINIAEWLSLGVFINLIARAFF